MPGELHPLVSQVLFVLLPPIIHLRWIILQVGNHGGNWYMASSGADDAGEKFIILDQGSMGPRVPHAIQEEIDSIVFVQFIV